MRVVAGELGGRKFDGPAGYQTRPTTDRVREAMFNALFSLNLVRGAVVADLFSGSGGLGIEALSRGATHCTFVENNRSTLAVLRSNIDQLGLADRATVLATDATTAVANLDADIVFADPPYDFAEWPQLLQGVKSDFVVAESAKQVAAIDGWEITRARRYGRSWITFIERLGYP